MKFFVEDKGLGINFIHFHKINDNLYRLIIDTKIKWPYIQSSFTSGSEEYETLSFYDKDFSEPGPHKLIGEVDIIPENEKEEEIISGVKVQSSGRYGYYGYIILEEDGEQLYAWESLPSRNSYQEFLEDEKKQKEKDREIMKDWPVNLEKVGEYDV